MTFVELIFKRAEGLIFSILFFSNFFVYMTNYFQYYQIVFIVYCFLVLLCLIEDFIFNNLTKDFRVNFNKINGLRYDNTILGITLHFLIMLLQLSNYKLDINNILIRQEDISISLDFFTSLITVLFDWRDVKKEIKNKPSFYIYFFLWTKFSDLSFDFVNFYHVYVKIKEQNEDKEIVGRLCEGILNYEKKILFLIWDIEKYTNKSSYEFMYFDEDSTILDVNNEQFEEFDRKNFTIEDNKGKFVDLKDNIGFYINIKKDVDYMLRINYNNIIMPIMKKYNIDGFMDYDEEDFKNEIKLKMEKLLREWREEWEQELKERKRMKRE
jgi:hypothetical protein